MCRKGRHRRQKFQRLNRFMQQKALILLQECHGCEHTLRNIMNQYPTEYRFTFNPGAHRGSGGEAVLIPWHAEAALASIPASSHPQIHHHMPVIAPGRVSLVSISNPISQQELRVLNVHNHDLGRHELGRVRQNLARMLRMGTGRRTATTLHRCG